MQFLNPLVRGILVERVKRYTAYIELEDGTVVAAHCPNGGAMIGLCDPGVVCWISYDPKPTRKLDWTWQLVEIVGTDGKFLTVGLNTLSPNRIVAEALAANAIPELAGYETVRREVKYGEASRIDFLLTGSDRPSCWLEIKNCHLRRAGVLAEFPDCIAARSAKHLRELSAMIAQGDRAVVLFTVQRQDCEAFSACRDIDPKFAQALDDAANAGVEVLVYECAMGTEAITLDRRIPWTP